MRRTMMAIIIFTTTIVAFYIFNITFGPALDGMYFAFNNITPHLNLTTGWTSVANKNLAQWQFIYKSITVVVIAVGVWVVLTIIGVEDYMRGNQ
jgi:hypothetical protein